VRRLPRSNTEREIRRAPFARRQRATRRGQHLIEQGDEIFSPRIDHRSTRITHGQPFQYLATNARLVQAPWRFAK
jgi:hypothetical protein